ncbi:MAG: ferrous iron transport protein B [Candidatus Lokiarchaeota archaeon]|nr:ferrous iron transport protein B [Candidatus Lokiarchaeota archaeon]
MAGGASKSCAVPPAGTRLINVALAGNANVGKSVIFTQLTGVSQTIGNWPGKTVEKKEGYLTFKGNQFNIVDLPGIYSLSTYSMEEIVSRQYIVSDDVDVIINVVDASNLERNLFFTFQLLELGIPVVLAVNQMDVLRARGMELDLAVLEDAMKVPAIPVVAVHGRGVHELLEEVIQMVQDGDFQRHRVAPNGFVRHDHADAAVATAVDPRRLKQRYQPPDRSAILSFGKEVEERVAIIAGAVSSAGRVAALPYPARFVAEKLLEGDEEIVPAIKAAPGGAAVIERVESARKELEDLHGEDISTVISAEIYNRIHGLVDRVLTTRPPDKKGRRRAAVLDALDHLTTHSFWGYVILGLVLYGTYTFTFSIGDLLGGLLDELFGTWSGSIYVAFGEENPYVLIFWNGAMGGFIGAVGGVLVYVVPFFIVIEILQDSGYLPRAAFMLDRFMHVIGVHGKAIIPMILGFGCNVPACAGCRIMETYREKKIALALSSLVPCAAVLVVVMGLVGRYLGAGWVAFLFAVNFVVIVAVGRLLNKVMPGQCTELIMEMHEYRKPNTAVILKQTWARTKEFVFKSIPMIVAIGVAMEVLLMFRLLDPFNIVLSPITVAWLGLPLITGVFLVYGVLRKELTLVLLEVLAASMGFAIVDILTPLQMLVFCMVTMLYVPCVATVVVMARESGWRYALKVALLEIAIALAIGGALNWIGTLLMLA